MGRIQFDVICELQLNLNSLTVIKATVFDAFKDLPIWECMLGVQ